MVNAPNPGKTASGWGGDELIPDLVFFSAKTNSDFKRGAGGEAALSSVPFPSVPQMVHLPEYPNSLCLVHKYGKLLHKTCFESILTAELNKSGREPWAPSPGFAHTLLNALMQELYRKLYSSGLGKAPRDGSQHVEDVVLDILLALS